ncbi:MAG: hypothetical protein LBN98_05525 [Prevotellaceae bacterium]|jgi:hypothetical protein|nr:hypothetical protein [Prevotellaceae bacterium]
MEQKSLEDQLTTMENQLKDGTLSIKLNATISPEHNDFFNAVAKIKKYTSISTLSTTKFAIAKEDAIINKTITDYPFKQGDVLSNEGTLIFQSYFNAVKNEKFNSIEIADYYLNEINKLNVTEETKARCNAFFSFHKDILLYLYLEDDVITSIKNEEIMSPTAAYNFGGHSRGGEWIPACNSRGCHDCCMYRKAYHLEYYATFIERVEYIVGLPGSFLWDVADCAFQCI